MWFICEKEGLAGATSVWVVIICSSVVLNMYILPRITTLHYFHLIATNSAIFLSAVAHLRAMLTDPGAVPKNAVPVSPSSKAKYGSSDDKHAVASSAIVHRYRSSSGRIRNRRQSPRRRICRHCKSFKPPNSVHCTRCHRCIIKIDHHCTWMNNCVAAENLKFFVQFLVYATWGSLHVTLLGLWCLLNIFFGFAIEKPAEENSPGESDAVAPSDLVDGDQQTTVSLEPVASRGAIAWSLVVTAITMTAAIFLLCVSRIQIRHMHHIAKKKRNKLLPVNTDATPGSPSDCA